MTERKPFLLRIDAELYAALARWADEETRSLNGQIESLLRRAVEADRQVPAPASRRPAAVRPLRRLPASAGRKRASPPHSEDRAPRRLSESAVPTLPAPRPAAPKPEVASPNAKMPVDSWDVMED